MPRTRDSPLLVMLVRSPAAVGLAVALLALAVIHLSPGGSRNAAWWPGSGVAVAGVACTTGRRRAAVLAAVALGTLVANLISGRPLAISAGFAVATTTEAAVAGLLLSRRGKPQLDDVTDIGRLLAAAIAGAVVGGIISAGVLGLLVGDLWHLWWEIAAAHGTAILILLPPVMRQPQRPPAGRAERIAVWAVLLASTLAVFGSALFVPFAFVPAFVLVWSGLRLGVGAAAAQLVAVTTIVTLFSAAGRGPFAAIPLLPDRPTPFVTEAIVQIFLACCSLVVLALAVTAAQREAAMRALAHQRWFDQAVLETVDAGVLACDADGTIVLRNSAHRRISGVADGGPAPAGGTPLRRALTGEVITGLDLRIGPVGGPAHDVVVSAVPILGPDGDIAGAAATFSDVTAERINQAHLRDSIAFHDAVLTTSPDMIYVADVPCHRLRFSSRPLSEVVGGSPGNGTADPDAMGGPELARILHDDDVARLVAADDGIAALGDGEIGKVRLRVSVGDGYRCLSRRVTPFARDAGGRVTQVLGIARDITDNVVFEDRLAAAALHDPLTGLPNRRLLVQRLDKALRGLDTALRGRGLVPVLFCDLDGFKRINDTAGHDIGDVVLRVTAARLRATLRSTDTVARVGGDEFVAVLDTSGPDGAQDARGTAARIVEALREPVVVDGVAHVVTVSVGVAFAAGGDDPAVALRAADRAMYRAKARGRGAGTGVALVDPGGESARAGVG